MRTAIGKRTTRQGRIQALVASVLLTGTVVVGVSADHASAAGVPVFPDNLVIFPDRDFLSAEGFDGHVGENALVQVIRGGEVIGAAEVTLEPGGVPFEVNHPGGYCWGNDVIGGIGFSGPAAPGDLPDVTPDIRPGDDIVVTFADGTTSQITTQDAYVAEAPENGTVAEPAVSGVDTVVAGDADFIAGFESRFTIRGRINTADPTFAEQRIVNPDLTDTAVGRRDIRAVFDPAGFVVDKNDSYMSKLDIDDVNDTFVATYLFRDGALAATAATGGGERLLTWMATDLNANRQGITIAEFGEPGGPGFGGCPNGPLQSGPPGPTNVQAGAGSVGGEILVTWTPATAIPATPAIDGYRVHAVSQTGAVEEIEVGRRINNPSATGALITGLDDNLTYDIQVVSFSAVGETFPAVHATADDTPPTLTSSLEPGTYVEAQDVVLTSSEAGQIWYTFDTPVVDGAGDPVPGAQQFNGTISLVGGTTTVNAVAFDLRGNSSGPMSFGPYEITNTPLTPTLSASAGLGSINVSWDSGGDSTITGYTVRFYDSASGGIAVETQTLDPLATSTTSTTLTEGTDYWVTIVASNASGDSPESARLGPLTPHGDLFASAGPDQTVLRGSSVQLDGTGSIGATSFDWVQVDPGTSAPVTDPIALTGVTPTFTFPATSPGPLAFKLTVSNGSGTAEDTVIINAEEVLANAGADQTVLRGSSVQLDGTGSIGATSFSWVQVTPGTNVPVVADPIALTGADTATPSFVFPATTPGPLAFQLTVHDESGASAVGTVTISAEAVVANAGADQAVLRGSSVQLNGSGSIAATSFSWVQVTPGTSAPVANPIALTGAGTATPSFVFPTTTPGPLAFQLTVHDASPGSDASDTVIVSALDNDPLAIARAQFRTSKNEWRFDGSYTQLANNEITIRLNKYNAAGEPVGAPVVLGNATLDGVGAWTARFVNVPPAQRPVNDGSTYTVTVTSTQGGLLADQQITTRN